jgi:mannose-1-phosphate guanylyltransferase
MLHAMIMAGGGGTRFWPRSRKARPKQFLALTSERSLLQEAVERIDGLVPPERTWVITGESYLAETARQLPRLAANRLVGEPFGRDTAACIGVGSALVLGSDPEATMLVMSADHQIEPTDAFCRCVEVAAELASERPTALITFGIPPSFPATGYGYIQRGSGVADRKGIAVYRVDAFREKPNPDLAEQFCAAGNYLWNSGIFVWKAKTILDQLDQNEPAAASAARRIAQAWPRSDRMDVFRREYEPLRRVSIDFAVMEKAPEVLVVQASYHWDDVGSWLALERMNRPDAQGNTVRATHCGLHTQGCVIVADKDHLIATVGVRDLLIVQDGNATLVADRKEEGAIKQLVEMLNRPDLEAYR